MLKLLLSVFFTVLTAGLMRLMWTHRDGALSLTQFFADPTLFIWVIVVSVSTVLAVGFWLFKPGRQARLRRQRREGQQLSSVRYCARNHKTS